MFSKISCYTSYWNWRGRSSCRNSLAAGDDWFYALGQKVAGVFGEAFTDTLLLRGLHALAEDFGLEREKVSR